MFMKRIWVFIISLFLCTEMFALEAKKLSREEYIMMYKDEAIRDMQLSGIPASIKMAQALLESSNGNSPLAREANNHFGIKCSNWNGPGYIQDDDTKDECFRKYPSVFDSYKDHSNFLRTRPRYAFLFEYDRTDYKAWAKGLKQAGYATSPTYAEKLIKIIEDFELYKLDTGGMPAPLASAGNKDISIPVDAPVPVRETVIHKPSVSEGISIGKDRKVFQINGTDCIYARKGDNLQKIANEFELGHWQIPRYNEMDPTTPLAEGQIVYLKPKKNCGQKNLVIAREGDTPHSIAQSHGVKLKSVLKYNNIQEGEALKPGQKIYLKKNS
ncbi:MAG: LysM peptidoglycan-binding domain-containing protein [Bacteroidetes bacterium]|nr:MAG: LysM peptidoglycan-binding domain-containing protein [Bacteroidota bacterium]